MGRETIIFIGAHPDDEVYGAGASIAKFSSQGKRIIVIILSYGEMSSFLMKRKIMVKARVKEDKKAQEILGVSKSYYLGLREGHFLKDAEEKNIYEVLAKIIKKYKPKRIITHSSNDAHSDHKATFKIVMKSLELVKLKNEPEVYSCSNIWGPELGNSRSKPQMIVDVSKFFNKKIQALRVFKTQKLTFWTLIWAVYIKAILNGMKIGKRYAEVFYRIK